MEKIDDYYYSNGKMYIRFKKLVYSVDVDYGFLCSLFWKDNTIWVNTMGLVTMGNCTEWKYFNVDKHPQVRSKGILKYISKLKWDWEIKKSVDYVLNKFTV